MSQKTDRVIAEILQKRDRFTKNFRTENHGGAAVIYGYPVHYKEGEEWKEIDKAIMQIKWLLLKKREEN